MLQCTWGCRYLFKVVISFLQIYTQNCWPFMYLVWKKVCSGSYAHFLFRLFVFLLSSDMISLYILNINSLSDKCFANIFFHSTGCFFTLLSFFFFKRSCAEAFQFDVDPLSILLCCLYFWCHIQNIELHCATLSTSTKGIQKETMNKTEVCKSGPGGKDGSVTWSLDVLDCSL